MGWAKTIGLLDKLRHRTLPKVQQVFALTMCGYLLVRLRTLVRAGLGHPPRHRLRLRTA